MRSGLIIFGIIFLVLGGLLYFVPFQTASVDTVSGGDVRTSSASITVPVEWAYASLIVGFVLSILGLVIPDVNNNSKRASNVHVIESKENVKVGKGDNRKITREKTETYNSREEDD